MRIGIHQVGYLPWLGFFDQIHRCDAFVLHLDVQYDRHSWRNRNRIRSSHGPVWLSVPVFSRGRFGQSLKEVKVDNHKGWALKHWKTLRDSYRRAPYFNSYAGFFESILLKRTWRNLVDLDLEIILWCVRELGIETEIILSTDLSSKATKTDGVISICRELGATDYLSSSAARVYLDEQELHQANIQFQYQDYLHPRYSQVYEGFIPYMGIPDLLFNAGPESLAVITRGQSADRCATL